MEDGSRRFGKKAKNKIYDGIIHDEENFTMRLHTHARSLFSERLKRGHLAVKLKLVLTQFIIARLPTC